MEKVVLEEQKRLSVRAQKVVEYTHRVVGYEEKRYNPVRPPLRSGTVTSASLSLKAAQRLRDAVNVLYSSAKVKRLYVPELQQRFSFKLNFITLTLPSRQIHTDREIHNKIFKKFIEMWKKSNPNLLYVYKAEVQDNGNLHYHLTTNSFIYHGTLRKYWNKCCNALGYVDRCSIANPNSTDVHAVKNVKNFAAYMCTYFSKKDTYQAPLKRFFRIHKKRLMNLKESSYTLPKNYFKRLKRKVTIKVWDASNALLLKPISMPLYTKETLSAYVEIKEKSKTAHYDYVSVTYVDIFKLRKENYIRSCYERYMQHAISITDAAVHILN